ncbi:GNAT family N-acetyltransferase [Mucilaginibacter sp. ZT4R22]|uniref:GNAT family N-acetyltransferase n=1 Tax=Mucilaginibacter pankratovii TaxID=2772110 RepID=A0ABR7WUX8_9SPHI|nr:GNAT family N-acetyltransferase [Mucilaginibacter pankratovii]MBD1366066.1 GNAT family N-acetyltransferase [Mucilaginibacter pankratovii]
MDYKIRQAEIGDLSELMLMIAAHAEYEKAGFTPDGKAERLAAALFETGRLHGLVVEQEGGELIGYATYTFDYSTWDAAEFMYLDCLFLKEKARGQKIGEQIINLLKEIGTARGCINIQWQTPDFNAPAIRFYKRNQAKGLNKVRFTLNLFYP